MRTPYESPKTKQTAICSPMSMAAPHRQNDHSDLSSQISHAPAHAINTEAQHLGKSPQFMHRVGGVDRNAQRFQQILTIRLLLLPIPICCRAEQDLPLTTSVRHNHFAKLPTGTTIFPRDVPGSAAQCTHVQRSGGVPSTQGSSRTGKKA